MYIYIYIYIGSGFRVLGIASGRRELGHTMSGFRF